jgi:hypothetical protein
MIGLKVVDVHLLLGVSLLCQTVLERDTVVVVVLLML